jgi:hypothetical protein
MPRASKPGTKRGGRKRGTPNRRTTGVNHDDGFGFPLTFYVPRYRRLTIELWRRLAAHYHDEPTILGYDLVNEPISPYK